MLTTVKTQSYVTNTTIHDGEFPMTYGDNNSHSEYLDPSDSVHQLGQQFETSDQEWRGNDFLAS